MECNITKYFDSVSSHDCSGSIATHGEHAARVTWNASKEYAQDLNLLDTPEKVQAFKDHIRDFGAWDNEEIESWAHNELNALLIQIISGDINESESLHDDLDDCDWDGHEEESRQGQVAGRMFKGVDDEIYYYLGD